MDKKSFNQVIRAKNGKVIPIDKATICYELPGTENNKDWFYDIREKIGFQNTLFTDDPKIKFNVFWDQIITE